MPPTLLEIAQKIGRGAKYGATAAANTGRLVARAFDETAGQPGAPIDDPQPFAPGTVSSGAIVAKTIQNIIGGMRQNANARLAREQRAEASRVQGLHATRLQQQIQAATLQDYKDPESGETYKLTGDEIRDITKTRLGRAPVAATVPRTLSDGTVVQVSGATALTDDDRDALRNKPVPPKASPDLSPRLDRIRKVIDERVDVEAANQMARFGNRRIESVRARALNGDREALTALGIPIQVVQELLGPTGDSASGTYTLAKMVDERVQNWLQPRLLDSAKRFARKKYASHYAAIDRGLAQSAGVQFDEGGADTDPVLQQIQQMLDEAEAEE